MTHADHTPTPTHDRPIRSVCVFCGSQPVRDPAYAQAAAEIGQAIAARGLQLVYGGGGRSLMGVVAHAAADAGGDVLGVVPKHLVGREGTPPEASRVVLTDTMAERKATLFGESDAVVTLPGGIGTFDELFEAMVGWHFAGFGPGQGGESTSAKADLANAPRRIPLGLLNTAGFYDKLIDFLDHVTAVGFILPDVRDALVVRHGPLDLLDALGATRPASLR